MAITRFDPFRDLAVLQDRMNRLFNDSVQGRDREDDLINRGTWTPAVDIYEDRRRAGAQGGTARHRREDIDVSVENNTLTIRGERKLDQRDQAGELPPHRARLRQVRAPVLAAADGGRGEDRRRLQERRADREAAGARGGQAALGEGRRRGVTIVSVVHGVATGSAGCRYRAGVRWPAAYLFWAGGRWSRWRISRFTRSCWRSRIWVTANVVPGVTVDARGRRLPLPRWSWASSTPIIRPILVILTLPDYGADAGPVLPGRQRRSPLAWPRPSCRASRSASWTAAILGALLTSVVSWFIGIFVKSD